jgi:putative spermidine/putrescine transport system substrate-binding protein
MSHDRHFATRVSEPDDFRAIRNGASPLKQDRREDGTWRRPGEELTTLAPILRGIWRTTGRSGMNGTSITRRLSLTGATALLASPWIVTSRAQAATTLTIGDNGGPVGASFREAFYDPYEKATGIKIVNVTQAVDPVAMIKVAVDTKAYTIDVHLLTPTHRYRLMHPADYLEPLELTQADVPGVEPRYLRPNYMGTDVWATVFAYRTDKFAGGSPMTWADFWNVEKFPGRRALYKSPAVNLEAALMADGVPWDKVYPMDVDRAFKSLDRIKPHIDVWWTSGAQSTQLLQSGEVDLLTIWSARAQTAIDAGTPAKIVWNGSVASLDGWGVPRGSPQAAAAREFIRFCAKPDRQAAYTTVMRNGPTNLAAYDKIPADRSVLLPTSPANRGTMLLYDDDWWGPNFAQVKQRFDAWLLEG